MVKLHLLKGVSHDFPLGKRGQQEYNDYNNCLLRKTCQPTHHFRKRFKGRPSS